MRFEIEQLDPRDVDWEPCGVVTGDGDRLTARAVEHVAETVGVYRGRPAASDRPWALYLLDNNGVAHRRDLV